MTLLRKLSLLLSGSALLAQGPESLVLHDLSGSEKSLSEFRGKVVVLNFWATWCIPCRQEMPLLSGIHNRYAARGVVVTGASADTETTQPQIERFVQKLGLSFPIWKGATTEHMKRLGLGEALPATAVIDQEGRIAFRILGVLQRKELEQRLEFLLAGRQGQSPEPLVDRIQNIAEEHHQHGGVGMEGASTVPS